MGATGPGARVDQVLAAQPHLLGDPDTDVHYEEDAEWVAVGG